MKIVKKIAVVLLTLIAIPLIIALFVPRQFHYEKDIVINRPINEVFDYLKHIKNQDNFGAWQLSDPDMETSSQGRDGTVGFKYSWDSRKMGKGSQSITHIIPHQKIETALDFGFGEPAASYFITEEPASGQTKVSWGISGKTPYPWNLMGLFYDMGDDFETGLKNLKHILEVPHGEDKQSGGAR